MQLDSSLRCRGRNLEKKVFNIRFYVLKLEMFEYVDKGVDL